MSVAELKAGDQITILVPAFNSATGVQLEDLTLPVVFTRVEEMMIEWVDRNDMKGWTPWRTLSGQPTEGILWCRGQEPSDVTALKVAHALAGTSA